MGFLCTLFPFGRLFRGNQAIDSCFQTRACRRRDSFFLQCLLVVDTSQDSECYRNQDTIAQLIDSVRNGEICVSLPPLFYRSIDRRASRFLLGPVAFRRQNGAVIVAPVRVAAAVASLGSNNDSRCPTATDLWLSTGHVHNGI